PEGLFRLDSPFEVWRATGLDPAPASEDREHGSCSPPTAEPEKVVAAIDRFRAVYAKLQPYRRSQLPRPRAQRAGAPGVAGRGAFRSPGGVRPCGHQRPAREPTVFGL